MNVLRGEVGGLPCNGVETEKLDKFRDELASGGVDTTSWGSSGTKTLQHLYWEVYIQRGSVLLRFGDQIKRVTHVLKIKMIADIFGVEHILVSRLQMVYSGATKERRQVPLTRLIWPENFQIDDTRDESLYAENCPYVENMKLAVKRALKERLGLNERWQEQYLEEDVHAFTHTVEDDDKSPGFPTLVTCYCIHEVTLRVADPENAGVSCIGLPSGAEFATTEGDFNFSMIQNEEGFAIGTQLNIWSWQTIAAFSMSDNANEDPTTPKRVTRGASRRSTFSQAQLQVAVSPQAGPALDENQMRQIKMVPVLRVSTTQRSLLDKLAEATQNAPSGPKKNLSLIQGFFGTKSIAGKCKDTHEEERLACPYLVAAQDGETTDWKRVRSMAKNIASANYNLKQFNGDIASFPELAWYLFEDSENMESPRAVASTTSGRTLSVEFQRTVGAFFAIYWLMRLHGDGKEGFTFGVDKEWRPVPYVKAGPDNKQLYPPEKRIKFYQESKWDYFEKLFIDAELFLKDSNGKLQVNEKRVVTLLALTAVHDLMKVEVLLPTVQARHAPYHGYKTGDKIADHDHALSYIMDHFPHLLPSFNSLEPEERLSVKFTQCQLQFNHGWFVQAEAPPGAIFTQFRSLLIRDHKSAIKERDIALYFVHWLTDLAGAEPTPLGGCEKFVVKFPLPVLNSFLRSFSYVQKISDQTETDVMEEYLCMRWKESNLDLGEVPPGPSAIAKMRLLCMAQTSAKPILRAFDKLGLEDQQVLNTEMARTGCRGQFYSSNLCPAAVNESPGGPALLIYYGPAFLQSLGNDDPVKRLAILAEVYRCGRELWNLSPAQAGQSVIIRVDTIKTLSVEEIHETVQSGKVWVLVKHNDSEAFVESSSLRKLNTFITNRHDVQVLDFVASG
jgi:hypothetical protein